MSVVAGVVVHGDRDWRRLEGGLEHVRRHVPERQRAGFVFQAKELFSGGETFTRENFDKETRWRILEELVCIPRELNIPIVIGYARRMPPPEGITAKRHVELEHMMAFADAILAGAWFMQNFASGEIATLIAEEVPEIQQKLRKIPRHLRTVPPPQEWIGGIETTSIKGVPYFCAKDEEPLLQMADACAFVTRRHAAGLEDSERFFRQMTGSYNTSIDFAAPGGRGAYIWRDIPPHNAFPRYKFPLGT